MHLKPAVLILLAWLLLLSASVVFADSDVWLPCNLTGVESVNVAIGVGDDASGTLLTKDRVQTEVELALRTAGVPVKTARVPAGLAVAVHVRKVEDVDGGDTGSYIYYVTADLIENVNVRGRTIGAITWSDSGCGLSSSERLADTVVDQVKAIADTFANDWLNDNPKP